MRYLSTACLILALTVAATSGFAADLLVNPGFEQIDEEKGFPVGWEPTYWSNPNGTIETADIARTGEHGVVLRGMPSEQITDRGGKNNHLVMQEIDISGTRRLTLTAHARIEGDGLAFVSMMTHDAEGNRLQYSSTQRYAGFEGWEPIVWSFTTNGDTEKLQIYLRNGGEGDVYYDDVSLSSPEDVLDNGAIAGIVNALVGGRISSLKVLDEGRERTEWRGMYAGGVAGVVVPAEGHPGVLRDLPWEMDVLEPNRKVALRRTIHDGDMAGLAFEKTLSVAEGSPALQCDLAVRNEAEEARTLTLRTQDCLPEDARTFAWDSGDAERVYHHAEDVLRSRLRIDDLAGGWIAAADADGNGLRLDFDPSLVAEGRVAIERDVRILEMHYRPVEIAPGETWQMSYSVAAISGEDLAEGAAETTPEQLPLPPPEIVRYPALQGIFPYGEYFRGYFDAVGPVRDYVADQLDTYVRNSFNTWIISENILLHDFSDGESSWRAEMAAERGMRLFPKGNFLRVFEQQEGGGRREVYPGDYTRQEAIARIEERGHTLERRRRFADVHGEHILAYDLADEPGPEHIHNYMVVQSIFREIDPHHPAVTILNFSRTEFIPYMPVYYGDEYAIRKSGRDPWSVFGIIQSAAKRTPGPVWVMLQAFGGLPDYSWHLPTGPEMRLMLWNAIAGGVKGITFHGSFSPPTWRVNKYYFYTAIDSLGAKTPCWDSMVEVGSQITSIGPAMLDCHVDTSGAFSLECEELEDYRGQYTGPAVRLGVLKQPSETGGRFLVAVNQHLDSPHQARLLMREGTCPEGAVLTDLHDAGEPAPASEPHDLTLAPGEGRILFCGSPARVGDVVESVEAKRAENLQRVFGLDAKIARANGIDVADAEALADDGTSAEALALLREDPEMERIYASLAKLDEVQELLSPIAQTFRDNWDVVVPPEDREGVGAREVWQNTQDQRMQQYVNEVAEAFLDRITLMRRIKTGEAADVSDEVEALVERAERLNEQAIAYVQQKAREADK